MLSTVITPLDINVRTRAIETVGKPMLGHPTGAYHQGIAAGVDEDARKLAADFPMNHKGMAGNHGRRTFTEHWAGSYVRGAASSNRNCPRYPARYIQSFGFTHFN